MEEMTSFFSKRAEEYDVHMLKNVTGCKEAYVTTPDGIYIECDYMVENQEEEDFYYTENIRIRKELGIPNTAFYHYDTPCTITNQIAMLTYAGFLDIEKVFRIANTTILVARKKDIIL
ncbi:MAG: hypothetical protein WCD89_23605 [Anaerocolumna sp.]